MEKRVIVDTIEQDNIIVGIHVKKGDFTAFIDRNTQHTEVQTRAFIDDIIGDVNLNINNQGYVETSAGILMQIGRIIEQTVSSVSTHIELKGEVTPNAALSRLKDDGTIGKNNWRFQLMQFAFNVFPEGIDQREKVVFMPGMGDEEFKVWKGFGTKTNNMLMIEGNLQKLPELQNKYRYQKEKPSYITSYLGKGDEIFPKELIENLDGDTVSVLSLDTESSLTLGLYSDLLGLFNHIKIKKDFIFVLNVVGRQSHNFSEKLLTSIGEKIPDKKEIIHTCLSHLPKQLLIESERDDLKIIDTQVSKYLGGSSTPMHYIFCHIRKK